jgi:hypothetical protein
MMVIFLKFVISVRVSHCGYLHRLPKYLTVPVLARLLSRHRRLLSDSNGSPEGPASLTQMAGHVTLVISFKWVVGIKEETSASHVSVLS